MTVGIKKLRKIQLGREGTPGSAAAATDVWRGTGTIEDVTPVIFPDEDVGVMQRTTRSYIPSKQAKLTMEETPATFQQILHILEAGIRTDAPAQDGTTGAGYLYEYSFPDTVEETLKNYTIEAGDNIEQEEFYYGFVEHFTLSGVPGEAVMLTADWVGRQVVTDESYTASITIPTVEEMIFSKGKLYIDDATGSHGGNQITGNWLEFNLDINTGWVPVTTGDGALYFTELRNTGPELMLDLTFEHDSTTLNEKDDWKIQQGKLVRITFEGSTFTQGDGSYEKETLKIDLAGKFESFEKLGERNGNNVLTGKFAVGHSSTAEYLLVLSPVIVNVKVGSSAAAYVQVSPEGVQPSAYTVSSAVTVE